MTNNFRTLGIEFAKKSYFQPAIECYQLYLELDPERTDIREKLSDVLKSSQEKSIQTCLFETPAEVTEIY